MAKKSSSTKKGNYTLSRWKKFTRSTYGLPIFFAIAFGLVGMFTLVRGYALTSIYPPQNLTATAISTSEIDLKWWPSSTANVSYRVYRNDTQVANINSWLTFDGSITYNDRGLSTSTTYNYRVEAYLDTASASTPTISATTLAPTPADQLGTINGKVLSGKDAIAGATVSIYYQRATHTATTGADGSFSLTGIPQGSYTITTAASGYKSTGTKVRVKGGQSINVSIKLRKI